MMAWIKKQGLLDHVQRIVSKAREIVLEVNVESEGYCVGACVDYLLGLTKKREH